MISNSIFQIALGVSLLTHIAIIAPLPFSPLKPSRPLENDIELNYIVIPTSVVTEKEEVYRKSFFPSRQKKRSTDLAPQTEEHVEHIRILSDELVKNEQHSTSEIEKDAPVTIPDKTVLPEAIVTSINKTTNRKQSFLKYHNAIREKIRAELHCLMSENGAITVIFTLDPDGHLASIDRVDSDLSRSTRRRSLKGIKNVQPFPPFPEALGNTPVRFSITIQFASS